MIWTHRGIAIPLEVYHGVPEGWYAKDILAEHIKLGGTFDIGGPEATEPCAPSWMPERKAWLQYRATLYRIGDGLTANDSACVELAVRYIELRHIGSYSGYIRSHLSRRLKHVQLSADHERRLHEHFSALVLNGERTEEYRNYIKLWRKFITKEQAEELLKKLSGSRKDVTWLSDRLLANHAAADGRAFCRPG